MRSTNICNNVFISQVIATSKPNASTKTELWDKVLAPPKEEQNKVERNPHLIAKRHLQPGNKRDAEILNKVLLPKSGVENLRITICMSLMYASS